MARPASQREPVTASAQCSWLTRRPSALRTLRAPQGPAKWAHNRPRQTSTGDFRALISRLGASKCAVNYSALSSAVPQGSVGALRRPLRGYQSLRVPSCRSSCLASAGSQRSAAAERGWFWRPPCRSIRVLGGARIDLPQSRVTLCATASPRLSTGPSLSPTLLPRKAPQAVTAKAHATWPEVALTGIFERQFCGSPFARVTQNIRAGCP